MLIHFNQIACQDLWALYIVWDIFSNNTDSSYELHFQLELYLSTAYEHIDSGCKSIYVHFYPNGPQMYTSNSKRDNVLHMQPLPTKIITTSTTFLEAFTWESISSFPV